MSPAPAGAEAPLRDALQVCGRLAVEKAPPLREQQLRDLFEGEVVRLYQPATDASPGKAVGLLISSQPRDRLWLAIRTAAIDTRGDYREQRLSAKGSDEVWFGYLKLPLFFGQRYWLTRGSDNAALAQATDNAAWEHFWNLVDDGKRLVGQAAQAGQLAGIGSSEIADAVYLSANRGSWILFALPGGRTLIIYQVVTVIGGIIPDELVARYAVYRIGDLLRDIEKQAAAIECRYNSAHPPVFGGDGLELPRLDRAL